jgi:hypothetical protein
MYKSVTIFYYNNQKIKEKKIKIGKTPYEVSQKIKNKLNLSKNML